MFLAVYVCMSLCVVNNACRCRLGLPEVCLQHSMSVPNGRHLALYTPVSRVCLHAICHGPCGALHAICRAVHPSAQDPCDGEPFAAVKGVVALGGVLIVLLVCACLRSVQALVMPSHVQQGSVWLC